jgi:phosphoglycerol transferase MdoB-like AlkP superfamily enzyme
MKYLCNITSLNFNDLKPNDYYVTSNKKFYDGIGNIEKTDNNMYKLIHIDGGHSPYDYGSDMKKVSDGTYDDAVNASISIIKRYLEMLKENDVYDNSVIVILADHGSITSGSLKEHTNPMLYVKGLNEKHDYNVSYDKVSYANINDAFIDLLYNKNGTEIFKKYNNNEREVYLYKFNEDNILYEYKQVSNAWDYDSLYYTGRTFIKK